MDFLLQIGFGQQGWACGNSSHTRAQLNMVQRQNFEK